MGCVSKVLSYASYAELLNPEPRKYGLWRLSNWPWNRQHLQPSTRHSCAWRGSSSRLDKRSFWDDTCIIKGQKSSSKLPQTYQRLPNNGGVHTFSNHFLQPLPKKKGVFSRSSRHFLLLRFFRMVRLVRLLRYMPEVIILVKGLGVASRSSAAPSWTHWWMVWYHTPVAPTYCWLNMYIYI